MLGASLAARESRLLSLATTKFLSGRVRVAAALFSGSVAASVTAWLAVASFQFVIAERDSRTLAYAIPLWVVQLVMPIGFARHRPPPVVACVRSGGAAARLPLRPPWPSA